MTPMISQTRATTGNEAIRDAAQIGRQDADGDADHSCEEHGCPRQEEGLQNSANEAGEM